MLPEIADALNRYSDEDLLRFAAGMLETVKDERGPKDWLNNNLTFEVIRARKLIAIERLFGRSL